MSNISVACKLPNGLIIHHQGVRALLKGANSSVIVGGHGITEGVDKEFFEAWLSEHKDFEPVKKGLIFAHEKVANVQAEAKEKSKNKSGFEGLDPKNPSPGIKPVTKDE